MTCLAIDDEPLALRQLQSYIRQVGFLELTAACGSAVEARRVLETEPVDLIFCDINMPDLNGMDFVRSLGEDAPMVIFTTAYSEYAVEGFRVNAVDYLLKPFSADDLRLSAQRAKEKYDLLHRAELSPASGTDPQDDILFFRTDSKIIRVDIPRIRYVEAWSEYIRIYLEGQKNPVVVLLSMKKLDDRLPSYFMRIHRSYIINLRRITEVDKNVVSIDGESQFPVGESYREAFQQYLDRKFLGK